MATKTAVISLRKEAIFIWAIPPLSPQQPDFFDDNHTHMAPLFTIPFPDGIELYYELIQWNTISSWYFGSSQPLYFDAFCRDSKLHRFQIILKPDLSTASLHLINTFELTLRESNPKFLDYTICEDTLVTCCSYSNFFNGRWDLFADVTLTSHTGFSANVLLPDLGYYNMLSWCAGSGRFVGVNSSPFVAVIDFFWYKLIIYLVM